MYEDVLQQASKEALNRSVDSQSDTDHVRNVVLLHKIYHPNEVDLTSLRTAHSVLRHLIYAFIVACPRDVTMMLVSRTRLDITTCDTVKSAVDLCIISGPLDLWREMLIANLIEDSPYDLRYVLNKVIKYFDAFGLNHLFSQYRHVGLRDGTFLLELKK